MTHESPGQSSLFDPDRLTPDGLPRDCPSCKGTGWRIRMSDFELEPCKNCAGTGRAIIPF